MFQEGFGGFGLVDEGFAEAQQHPIIRSQNVQFNRASNTSCTGLAATDYADDGCVPVGPNAIAVAIAEVGRCPFAFPLRLTLL